MQVTKYNASGNDFIVYHDSKSMDRSKLAKMLCHRQKGIGADGLVVLEPHDTYDFVWDFYNSDGSYAKMCGNATRAVAHYANEKGISLDNKAEFLTGAGVIRAEVNGTYVISDMTEPEIIRKDIVEDGENWWLIDSGVPHLVSLRDDVGKFDLTIAKELREKYDANVNICKISKDGAMRVRTYERGVEGETLACGTGIMACYIKANDLGLVKESSTKVVARSGDELYMELVDGVYRYGGQVTKTFTATTDNIRA